MKTFPIYAKKWSKEILVEIAVLKSKKIKMIDRKVYKIRGDNITLSILRNSGKNLKDNYFCQAQN